MWFTQKVNIIVPLSVHQFTTDTSVYDFMHEPLYIASLIIFPPPCI